MPQLRLLEAGEVPLAGGDSHDPVPVAEGHYVIATRIVITDHYTR